jgi:hypothetical protein
MPDGAVASGVDAAGAVALRKGALKYGFDPNPNPNPTRPELLRASTGEPATRGSGRGPDPNPTRYDGFGRLTNPRPEGLAQIENPTRPEYTV